MSELEFHPIADLFPMMGESELEALATSIATNGQRQPILLYEGKILDGRNRYKACLSKGIKPIVKEWTGDDPWEFVWDENAERRHLPEGQKAVIYLLKKSKQAEWQEERRRRQEDANRARSEATKEQPRDDGGLFASGTVPRGTVPDNRSRNETAEKAGVSPRTAGRAEALANARPDLAEKVAQGEMSLPAAMREKKKDELTEAEPLEGKYRVLYADPPWKYNNKGLDDYGHAERHYPTMSISDLCALPVKGIVEDDAVLFLWVTSPMLESAFKIVRAWGFQYKTSFVWDKVKHNFGHYNSVRHEFLLVCTRGSCTPQEKKLFDSVQSIERTDVHSEKPEEFRSIIETLYPSGRRMELFARRQHDGWSTWGNEANG